MQPIPGLKLPETLTLKSKQTTSVASKQMLCKLTPSTSCSGPQNSLETTAKSELESACSCACTSNGKNVLAPHFTYKVQVLSHLYHFLRSQSKDCLENHSPSLLSLFFHALVLFLLNEMVTSHRNLNTHQLDYNS